MAGTLSYHQQLQLECMSKARRQVLQHMAISQRQQQAMISSSSSAQNTGGKSKSTPFQPSLQQTMQPQSTAMGSAYDDLPIDPNDYDAIE